MVAVIVIRTARVPIGINESFQDNLHDFPDFMTNQQKIETRENY